MVKMASKLTFGLGATDWQERINVARMRDERAERARQIMRKYNIPALLVSRADNCRYLTGLCGPEFSPQLWYVLFFAEHDPVVFHTAGWIEMMPPEAPWIKQWRLARCWLGGIGGPELVAEESKRFAADIHKELQDRGLAGEKLGVVSIDGAGQRALNALGVETTDFWPQMLEARAIKTVDEINCLKAVAAMVEAAWYRVWQELRPGIRDSELPRVTGDALIRAGADDPLMKAFRSGPATATRAYEGPGRMIQHGDLVYASLCGIGYMGYRSCNYRTFIAGRKPNDQEKDWYKQVLDRLDAIIDAAKPGVSTAELAKFFPPATTGASKTKPRC